MRGRPPSPCIHSTTPGARVNSPSPLRASQGRTARQGGDGPRWRILNLLSYIFITGAVILLAEALWIPVKAEVAQILLQRAFNQSMATGEPVKAWGWADTWPVAKLRFPRLGASAIALHGATGEALAFGPSHLADTPRPGERGTSVFAAHRDTHFAFLREVLIGDDIDVQRADGMTFRYRIIASRIARWNASGINRHAPGYNLVLSTCWPLDGVTRGDERLIVEARMVE